MLQKTHVAVAMCYLFLLPFNFVNLSTYVWISQSKKGVQKLLVLQFVKCREMQEMLCFLLQYSVESRCLIDWLRWLEVLKEEVLRLNPMPWTQPLASWFQAHLQSEHLTANHSLDLPSSPITCTNQYTQYLRIHTSHTCVGPMGYLRVMVFDAIKKGSVMWLPMSAYKMWCIVYLQACKLSISLLCRNKMMWYMSYSLRLSNYVYNEPVTVNNII